MHHMMQKNAQRIKTAEAQRDQAVAQLNASAAQLEQANQERDQAIAERNQANAQREQANAQYNEAIAKHERAIAERDDVIAQRNQLTIDRDEANKKLNEAIARGDTATAEQRKAIEKFNEAIMKLDNALTKGDKAIAELDKVIIERNKVSADLDKEIAKSNKAIADLDKTIAKLDVVVAERDKAMTERDSALAQSRELTTQLDAIKQQQLQDNAGGGELQKVARTGNFEQLQKLLETHPADEVNVFLVAALNTKDAKCKQLLVDTALYYAAKQDNIVSVKIALNLGGDPLNVVHKGENALGAAVYHNNNKVIELFQESIDTVKKNRASTTTADTKREQLTSSSSSTSTATTRGTLFVSSDKPKAKADKIDALLESKAKMLLHTLIERGDYKNSSPLVDALQNGDREVVERFVQLNALTIAANMDGSVRPPSYEPSRAPSTNPAKFKKD